MTSEEVKKACDAIRAILVNAVMAGTMTQDQIDALKGNATDELETLALEALAKREDDQ